MSPTSSRLTVVACVAVIGAARPLAHATPRSSPPQEPIEIDPKDWKSHGGTVVFSGGGAISRPKHPFTNLAMSFVPGQPIIATALTPFAIAALSHGYRDRLTVDGVVVADVEVPQAQFTEQEARTHTMEVVIVPAAGMKPFLVETSPMVTALVAKACPGRHKVGFELSAREGSLPVVTGMFTFDCTKGPGSLAALAKSLQAELGPTPTMHAPAQPAPAKPAPSKTAAKPGKHAPTFTVWCGTVLADGNSCCFRSEDKCRTSCEAAGRKRDAEDKRSERDSGYQIKYWPCIACNSSEVTAEEFADSSYHGCSP